MSTAQYTDVIYQCRICGRPLMNTHSGAVCPSGHGLLMPKMPKDIARRNHHLILGMQEAAQRGRWWYVGDEGPYRAVKKHNKFFYAIPHEGEHVFAINGTGVIELERV